MTPGSTLMFLLSMLILAAIPSVSVALVVSLSATRGIRHGAAAAAGIVTGDIVFIIIALLGLGALAQTFAPFFTGVQIIASLYLLWTGIRMMKAHPPESAQDLPTARHGALAGSFAAGFLLTLGDMKAILFYAGVFPAFFDLRQLGISEFLFIAGLTALTVGGVKLGYAACAASVYRKWAHSTTGSLLQRIAALLMMGAGLLLISRLLISN